MTNRKTAKSKIVRLLAAILATAVLAAAAFVPMNLAYADDVTFAPGSLIIPMDETYQNMGMWKAYGLVYNLLSNGIPVSWAISDTKTYNGVDFTATTGDLQTGAAVGSYSYRGGPFIISSEDAARALPLIQAWWAKYPGLPVVHTATDSFTANIDAVLRRAPRIANELTNSGVSMAYYNIAGIPDSNGKVWTSASPNVLDQTEIAAGALFDDGPCSPRKYDIFVTPHNGGYAYSLTDPTNLGTRTYAELDYFNHQGGGWIACCHSLLSNEDAISDLYLNSSPAVKALFRAPVPGGMLTVDGFHSYDNVGGTWTVHMPTLPTAQSVPIAVTAGLPGGAIQTWQPTAVEYYPETERVAGFIGTDGTPYDMIVAGVGHDGSTQGKITFIGGHSYSTAVPYTKNDDAMYLRMFYNSLFFNSVGVPKINLLVSPDNIPQNRLTTVTLEMVNEGACAAINTSEVEIRLEPGLTYQGMAEGPEPVSVTGDPSTGVTLSWGNSLGTIDASSSVFKINIGATADAVGEQRFCSFSMRYGDVFGEHYRAEQCRAIQAYATPAAAISKSPETQTAYIGSVVSWTLDYGNPGEDILYNAVVEDYLPAGTAFKSSVPAPSYPPVVLPDGRTRVRWLAGDLAAGASGSVYLTAYTSYSPDPVTLTNHVSLSGSDWNGFSYSAVDEADVDLTVPPVSIVKSVSPEGAVEVTASGEVLTYSLRPEFRDEALLGNVMISDPVPQYTTYVGGSANAGGSYGFTPLPKEDGVDAETFASPRTTTVSLSASPTLAKINDTVTVTMTITNNSGTTISNIVPTLTERLGPDGAAVSEPSASGFTLANGASRTVTFTCVMTGIGERMFTGGATGVSSDAAVGDYTFTDASSNTVLVTNWLNASPAGDVMTWRLGSNTPAVDGFQLISGNPASIYSFYGNDKNFFYRYDLLGNTWAASANYIGTAKEGGSLAYDGGGFTDGYIYGLRGDGSATFGCYDISANTWAPLANTPVNVKNGGALVYLNGYAYALGGNGTKNFWRYDPAANTWTATGVMANTPQNVKDGGALTTDGTYIYAFRGEKKPDFWRYDPVANTWALMASAPANVGQGGALTCLNGYIFATRGDGKTDFWRYDIANNTWSAMAKTPAGVAAGGAMTTDGTYIYATQGGGKKTFWRYDPAANTWAVMAPALQNVGWGGALAYVPPESQEYRLTDVSVNNALVVTTGDTVTITLNVKTTANVSGVVPSAPVVTSANGASAALLTGPVLVSADNNIDGIDDPVAYQWTYSLNAGAVPGSVSFTIGATGDSGVTFPTATSQSILVSPVLTYQVRIAGSASLPAEADEIVNAAMLSENAAFGYGIESNAVVTPLLRPFLTIVKTNSPDHTATLKPGDAITYTLVLKNEGTGTAHNVVITDAVPAHTSYIAGSAFVQDSPADPGRTMTVTEPAGGSPLTVNIDTLQYGESVTLKFRVTADMPAAQGTYTAVNQAAVSSAEVPAFNSNAVENTIAYYINPSFDVFKSADPDHIAKVGETVTYDVILTNTGDVPLSSVTVDDPLIAGLAYVYGDEDSDNILDLTEVWQYEGTYIIREADVGADGTGIIVNTVTADTAETGPQTAEAVVEIKLAKTKLTVTKTVTTAPDSGYGAADAQTPFIIRLAKTDGSYSTDLLLKAGETAELEVPCGTYTVTEPAMPLEYTKTGTQAIVYANGLAGEPFTLGSDNLVELLAYRAELEITNDFEHTTYFHDRNFTVNRFASGP